MRAREIRKSEMFSEQAMEKVEAQEGEWRRCVEGHQAAEREIVTRAGIKLKPVYSPLDIAEMSPDDIPLPGQYPYIRGLDPLGYRAKPWTTFQVYGFGTADETRERWNLLQKWGACDSIGEDAEEKPFPQRVATDLPHQRGYDPDDPEARGRVGGCGVSLSTREDMKSLMDSLPLDKLCVQLVSLNSSVAANALYIAYAQTRGYSPDQLFMRGHNILYQCCQHDVAAFPPKYTLRIMTEWIHYCVKHMPRSQHTGLAAYNVGENAGTAIHQIAFMLALAIELTEECIKVGLDPDDVVPGFYWHEWGGMDLFEEVAKCRGERRLWARIFRDRFGCKKPEALRVKNQTQSSGSSSVAQEPLNNIIRSNMITLAAILAGVDGIHTTAYDEPLCVPTEESARIALRTQQILYHETTIPHVVDPLGGSYYVEWLTKKIEEGALECLDEMERQGGFFKCWETGWIRSELEKLANERQHKIDRGEIVIVGQNRYRLPDDQQPEVPVFPSFDPRAEEEAIARIKRYREQRDQEKVRVALAGLRQAAEAMVEDWPSCCGALVPRMIDAYLNHATLGEVQRVMREVCGYTYVGV